ncbi:CehA/McbA family metallohydrolase [Clostridium sp. YIM B02505]|uniref:CehA/McbA family metallohydrolase n=1 Tax=Clostridium yunnanense TaxID=2800325 RepID=A0ABS1EWE1_9CLOT|nr:CehA/McbA family metallohydrolase [Clostridium yunnanense]MBK1813692.1 CehA/McbA family metallohydrolase [Clostridium yunnanense]
MSKHRKHRSEDLQNFDPKNIKILYGIPHCHTNISTGKCSAVEALEYAKKNRLDFLIITDHNRYFSSNSHKEHNSKWDELKKALDRFNKKNEDFVGIVGFEASSNPWGHLNIVNSSSCFTGVIRNFNNLMLWMIANGNCYISINHPGRIVEQIPFSPFLNKFINTIEVGNGSYPNKYHRYSKRYFSMLDKGWMLGAVNAQDNHLMNFGDTENLTGVLVNKLDKPSIISSLKNRRCFSSESRTLKFYFTINNSFMGEELIIEKNNSLNFYIHAEDRVNIIEEVQIITSGGKILKALKEISLHNLKYSISFPASEKEKWYVIRLIQKNNREAISSPIFIKIKNS